MSQTMKDQAVGLRLMWGGFWSSRIIITANNFRIFDQLTKPVDANHVAMAVGCDPRATEVLLNALAALRLIKKSRQLYSNLPIASRFLVTGSKYYQGDILKHADNLWNSWSQLDMVLKTGKAASSKFDHNAFIMGMHNIAQFVAPDIVQAIGGIDRVESALDLGGGPGTYSIELLRQGAKAVTHFDLNPTTRIARKLANEANVKDKLKFISGDVLHNDIGGGYDLVLISQFIHAFSPEETSLIFSKSFEALRSGGRIAVHEFRIDPSHASPTQGALFSVNMLVGTNGGRCYPAAEISAMLRKAGFVKPLVSTVTGNNLVIATKR